MDILHKILVEKDTGKVIHPAYPLYDPRPEPPDAVWVQIKPGDVLYHHYSMIPPQDAGNLDLNELYWDFETENWIESITDKEPTLSMVKFSRNELLKQTDKKLATITDPDELQSWIDYRQQLRDMFVGLPDDFRWSTIVFPRSPSDIAELKRLAAEGDPEAAAIVLRDNL